MSTRQVLIETVEAAYSAFSHGKVEALLQLCDPACRWQVPGLQAYMPWAGQHVGHAGVISFVAGLHTHLDFLAFAAHGLVVDEAAGQVVALGRATCRVKATGRLYHNDWAHLFSFQHGLISGLREYPDTASQLAAIHPALLADPHLSQEA